MSIEQLKPETTYPAIVGRILVSARKDAGLEQAQLARQVGMSQSTWSRIERGESALTVEQLAKAATALGTTVGRILTDADRATKGLEKQGVEVFLTRPKDTAKTALAVIGIAALALLVAQIIKK